MSGWSALKIRFPLQNCTKDIEIENSFECVSEGKRHGERQELNSMRFCHRQIYTIADYPSIKL